ncbi:MAG: hypothetical protein L0387_25665 [Acidobacteria bacterium]|nr:hypothetical protein [Acidobacteriota bacterium]MCI0624987.1 hypothetical protein [Acidobacteriota bacterium]MCI0717899.1 hypothetical protein [Acidobacteriota bacterium]
MPAPIRVILHFIFKRIGELVTAGRRSLSGTGHRDGRWDLLDLVGTQAEYDIVG